MSNATPTLLLTSSVYVSAPFVKLSDTKLRIELTLNSIEKWTRIKKDINIVVCDGSGYDFSGSVAERFPESNIECINFRNNAELVRAYGKGYGEGEIIDYALKNSKYLSDSDYFVKCTSKLWVSNFSEIMTNWNNLFQCECYFKNGRSITKVEPVWIDTRFYIIRKNFYIKHFISAHENVRDNEGYYLEHCFKDAILHYKLPIDKFLFPYPALIEGVSGTSGKTYSPPKPTSYQRLKRFIKLIAIKANRFIRINEQ